ncbi:iron ABC transporter substrate-binding protein [Azospirillum canadense]|uniref:iron ABC transporter substrate-binding protein n=1 Tax=Azospirillum canadense TaxID=403962 RepID=UPI0022261251|nr:iron ABC transporter substrate-binding protein [Azospirillum canadense]MCW2240156.1 iron complex transport system substrate-binding protein [Azospirillum canadense]
MTSEVFGSVWRLRLAASLLLGLAVASPALADDGFTDSAGRRVPVPPRVERVFPAGPPASVVVYMLAPDRLLGWTRAISPPERPFLPDRYADLPELGRLTGRGNTVNLEAVVGAKPDLVLDVGSTAPTFASLADRVQEQTGVPTVLVDGHLADSPRTFRTVGALLGVPEAGERLARYAEDTLADVRRRLEGVPPDHRLKVYMARGPRGLQTGLRGSINMEALEVAGVRNVAAEALGDGGLVNVSMEQVLAWQPDAIVTIDRGFYESVWTDPLWQGVKAVRDKRVYLSPGLPFTWIDSPPAANRLLGLRWLGAVLYPDLFPEDLREETRRFHALFYHRDPTDQQIDALLAGSRPPG